MQAAVTKTTDWLEQADLDVCGQKTSFDAVGEKEGAITSGRWGAGAHTHADQLFDILCRIQIDDRVAWDFLEEETGGGVSEDDLSWSVGRE